MLKALVAGVRSRLSGKGASTAARKSDGATRDDFGIMVTGKDLVMQVYLDTEDNYSVQGYAERTRKSSAKSTWAWTREPSTSANRPHPTVPLVVCPGRTHSSRRSRSRVAQ